MNEAGILESKWTELRERAGQHWKALTDEDLDAIDGSFDVLSDLLQEKYGYSRALAEDDIKRFVREQQAESMQGGR